MEHQLSVKRRYQVRGRDENQLLRRIGTLLHAIRVRGGSILGIKWTGTGAMVRYEIPVIATDGNE